MAQCSICTEDFDSEERCPRLLQCGHTFCSQCLETLADRAASLGDGEAISCAIPCPFDRIVTRLDVPQVLESTTDSSGTVKLTSALPKNVFWLEIIRLGDQTGTHGPVPITGRPFCDACSVVDIEGGKNGRHLATHWCEDCGEFMCSSRYAEHSQRKPFRSHKAVTVAVAMREKWLGDLGAEWLKEVEDGVWVAQGQAKLAKIQQAQQNLLVTQAELQSNCETTIASIHELFNTLCDRIRDEEKKLVARVEHLCKTKLFMLTDQQKCLGSIQVCTQRAIDATNSLLKELHYDPNAEESQDSVTLGEVFRGTSAKDMRALLLNPCNLVHALEDGEVAILVNHEKLFGRVASAVAASVKIVGATVDDKYNNVNDHISEELEAQKAIERGLQLLFGSGRGAKVNYPGALASLKVPMARGNPTAIALGGEVHFWMNSNVMMQRAMPTRMRFARYWRKRRCGTTI